MSEDRDPNALRERELDEWLDEEWPEELDPDDCESIWSICFRAGFNRAWSKCSEVAEDSIKELTAELERHTRELTAEQTLSASLDERVKELTAEIESYRRTISAEYSKREALDEELSQLRATVERVRCELLAVFGGSKLGRADHCTMVGNDVGKSWIDALSAAPAPASPSWSKPITDWQRETFGKPTVHEAFARAEKEWKELQKAMGSLGDDPESARRAAVECADVVITLARVCERLGFDLAEIEDWKMGVNRERDWVLDGHGGGGHVKEGEES